MVCECTKSSRDIYCSLHGDEQYLEVQKPDKKVTKIDKFKYKPDE